MDAYRRGQDDCIQDYFENAPFASVGGLDRRSDMVCPDYIKETHHRYYYLKGYQDQAYLLFGPAWETVKFGWHPAIEIKGREKVSEPLFIYHGGCFDGFTSAWVYRTFVRSDAEFIGAKYGDPIPDCRGREVIIADFSWKRPQLQTIALAANSLLILDHHKTAQEDLVNFEEEMRASGKDVKVVFDMERSGAGIVWDYFLPHLGRMTSDRGLVTGDHIPYEGAKRVVNYVEDRDLWRFALPLTKQVNAVIYSTPMTWEGWDQLSKRSLERFFDQGEAVLQYMEEYGTKALAHARLLQVRWFEGEALHIRPVWTVNLPYMNCSDYLNRLLEEKGTPFVMGYFRRADGRWQFSLRSRPDVDCSVVAKHFKGGGHAQAAGFDVARLTKVFEEPIDND